MTIRRLPEDFAVTERLSAAFAAALVPEPSPGAHAVYSLAKTALTTPEACAALARALGVRHELDYAGLKDKHARTAQHASAPAASLPGEAPPTLSGQGWRAELMGFSPEPVTPSSIDGNRFRIVVRDLSKQASDELTRRADLLRDPAATPDAPALLLLNYFGDQRFGSARHGRGFVASALIRGDFETALRLAIGTPSNRDTGPTRIFTRLCAYRWGNWEALSREAPRVPEARAVHALAQGRDFREAFATLPPFLQAMFVEAHQSHLWNDAGRRIARLVSGVAEPVRDPSAPREHTPRRREPLPLLHSTGLSGDLLFPIASAVTPEWRSAAMPTPAPSTELAPPWGDALAAALNEEGVTLKDLRIPGLKRPFFGEAMRPVFVSAQRAAISAPERDDLASTKRFRRTLDFDLPRGAYATVVLRALGQ